MEKIEENNQSISQQSLQQAQLRQQTKVEYVEQEKEIKEPIKSSHEDVNQYLEKLSQKITQKTQLILAQTEVDRQVVLDLLRFEHQQETLSSMISKRPDQRLQNLLKQSIELNPTEQQITQKIQFVRTSETESNWTDATQSQADYDDILYVDEQMMQQMEESSDQDKEDKIDYEELEGQFIKGKDSDQHCLYGSHDKFCVSVSGTKDGKYLFSGSGDDKLFFYKIIGQKSEKIVEQFHILKHTQTITKIEVSFDDKFVLSLTDNELYITQIETLQSKKVQIESPTDVVCHKMGGVFAVSYEFNVSIYNIKGLQLFNTYCLDQEPTTIQFTETGKQIVAVCDNKVRIITPKTSEIVKVAGSLFHKAQITSLVLKDNLIFSSCLEGFIYYSNLIKGNILGGIEKINGSINNLVCMENYLICGTNQEVIYWYEITKMKLLFIYNLKSPSTTFLRCHNQNTLAISTVAGEIFIFDRRTPLKPTHKAKCGNTVHQMYYCNNWLYAACEDGKVRAFDFKSIELWKEQAEQKETAEEKEQK